MKFKNEKFDWVNVNYLLNFYKNSLVLKRIIVIISIIKDSKILLS